MLTENARKTATPPNRGSADWWTCRLSCGSETQPLRLARSRTERVATNETNSEKANKTKKSSVKTGVPFPLKNRAF